MKNQKLMLIIPAVAVAITFLTPYSHLSLIVGGLVFLICLISLGRWEL